MKYIGAILFAAFALFAATAVAHADEQRIVIVAGADSIVKAITAKDARRAYLGSIVVQDGVEIRPLRNLTDKLAGEVFLQKVLFMSSDAYDRQLLTRTFRGGSVPKSYDNLADLLAALHSDNVAITYMLYETAVNTPGIRIIGNP